MALVTVSFIPSNKPPGPKGLRPKSSNVCSMTSPAAPVVSLITSPAGPSASKTPLSYLSLQVLEQNVGHGPCFPSLILAVQMGSSYSGFSACNSSRDLKFN